MNDNTKNGEGTVVCAKWEQRKNGETGVGITISGAAGDILEYLLVLTGAAAKSINLGHSELLVLLHVMKSERSKERKS